VLAWAGLGVTLCHAGAISVNGTCMVGNCTLPDTLSIGQSTTLNLSTVITLANTDQFQVVFNASPSDSAGLLTLGIHNWSATYLGNQTNTASGADQIVLDAMQNFEVNPPETFGLNLTFSGIFLGGISPNSSIATAVILNGSTAATVGPANPPGSFSISSTGNPPVSILSSPLLLDRQFTFDFGAGSAIGSEIASSAPEPGGILLALSGVAGLVIRKRRC